MILMLIEALTLFSLAAVAIYFAATGGSEGRSQYLQDALTGTVLGGCAVLLLEIPLAPGQALLAMAAGPLLIAGAAGGVVGGLAAMLIFGAGQALVGPYLAPVLLCLAFAPLGWGLSKALGLHRTDPIEPKSVLALAALGGGVSLTMMVLLGGETAIAAFSGFFSTLIMGAVLRRAQYSIVAREMSWRLTQRLNLITDTADVGMWSIGPDGAQLSVCPRQRMQHGLPIYDTLCFTDWMDTIEPEDRPRIEGVIAATLTSGGTFEEEYRIDFGEGLRHIKIAGAASDPAEARAAGITGVALDITALRSSERRERRSEDRLEVLAETAPGALLEYTHDAEGENRISYISPACETIWELDVEAVLTDPGAIWRQIAQEDRADVLSLIEEAAEEAAPWSGRWRIITPSGSEKWLYGVGRPHTDQDGVISWSCMIHDMSADAHAEQETKRRRETLHRSQQLESLGKLTGGVAHDFNNLLAIVMGNMELLKEQHEDPEALGHIDEAMVATRRGADLTRNLLTFARRASLTPRSVDLNDVARQTADLVLRSAPATIEFSCDLSGDLWRVIADRAASETALMNLMRNACDAMPSGGKLSIETTNFTNRPGNDYRPELTTGARYVMVRVSDTGIGIDPTIGDRVFEPFFSSKERGLGAGLGLSMVEGFIEQTGGVVELGSVPGKGTEFLLFFPATLKASDQRRKPAPRVHAQSILVVEDDAPVRKTFVRMLRRDGYEVAEASSGDEALSRISAGASPDLVITDIVMPGEVQGPDLREILQLRRPGLPVIMMSGYGEQSYDGDLHLRKPPRREDLLDMVAGALQQPEASSAA